MSQQLERPAKVVITGGHEIGGITSFAEGLADGFRSHGIPVEIVPPLRLCSQWGVLRDRSILKILSTTAGFAAPFARRAICVGHGCPPADVHGWPKVLGFLATYKLANLAPEVKFVPVSDYAAVHYQHFYNLKIDAVIHNPLRSVFLEAWEGPEPRREYVTYVGRLHPVKNLIHLLPAIRELLDESPGLRARIVGEGELLPRLCEMAAGDQRIEFTGNADARTVRDTLRKSRIFVSGCPTESMGITYLEALSQGCAVVMPACGGGIELAPELVGSQVQLMSITMAHGAILDALRRAMKAECRCIHMQTYSARAIAAQYLEVDENRHFSAAGWIPSRMAQ